MSQKVDTAVPPEAPASKGVLEELATGEVDLLGSESSNPNRSKLLFTIPSKLLSCITDAKTTVVSEVCSHGNHFVRKPQESGLILHLLSQPLPQERKLGQGSVQMSSETGPQVEGEKVLLGLVEAGKRI